MKKTLSLVLALAMCLSLAACGNNGTQDQSSQSGSNTSASDVSSGSQQGDNSSVDAADSDWAKIESNGTMKIGITYFEPMNYFDDNGELTGFETEFATAVCEKLGVTPEFVEIISNFSQDETANANILTEKERMLCILAPCLAARAWANFRTCSTQH